MASHPDEAVNKRKHVDYDQKCVEERKGGATEACRRGYPREDTPPAQCSVLCGPRSCSTLPSSLQNDGGTSPPEPKRRRLWGLRGLVKMFRRRVRRKAGPDSSECPDAPAPTLRARSASELTVDPNNRTSSGPYNQGLSVSHDSVFSPDSPTEQTHTAPPGLSLATRGVNMSELKAALRRRRGLDSGSVEDDLDDPGLPRSPQTSPTTLDVLNHGLKSSSRGGQSSCSDGSLLSMGSSENDEDSFGLISHHSSKHSLIEGRHQIVDHEPAVGAAPLSHKAARHKISVKPKRTHGVPRTRRQAQVLTSSLPVTPEVNEDLSVRSGASVHNTSFSPPFRPQEKQRPSSISFSSIETQIIKTRSEVTEDRKNARKSLPEPASHSEEKKDEPLLSRLFGSVRSGQQQPPTQTEDSVVDVLVSSDGNRVSREKRKDPFKAPTGIKSSRQKSDPSRFPHGQQQQHQQECEQQPTERNGSSHRSSSVEGRLEGNPFDDSFERPRQYEFVGDVSYAVRERREDESEVILRRAVMVDKQETTAVTRGVVVNRLSSSYDSLDNDEMLPETLLKKQSVTSLESCEGRSSTDSLTTTPLPGIYIRSNHSMSKLRRTSVQNQAKENIARWREEHPQQHHHQLAYHSHERDFTISGPMSLDSSLSAVQYEEELRKSAGLDEMDGGGDLKGNLPPASRMVTVLRSASVHSSTSSSRGSSARSRKSSIGDELESDSSLPRVSLRKVNREPSLKKTQPEAVVVGAVPEFMRIQLNRVQSKGNSIIFDTDQQMTKALATAPVVHAREEPAEEAPAKHDPQMGAPEESEKPKEQSEIIVEEKNLIEVSAKREPNVVTSSSSPQAVSHPATCKGGSPKPPHEESQQHHQQHRKRDEIILRRPSVVDRAIVIDQTMGALPSSPTPTKDNEEPELFKVFARRSFKLKDAEMEAIILHGEPNSEMDKENHVPLKSSVDGDQTANMNKKNERSSDTSTIVSSMPTLKSISSKRYSLGSAIPAFATPIEHTSTVIVLSGNNAAPTDNCETKMPVAAKTCVETETPKNSLKTKEKLVKTSVFGRSKSQSPHTPQSDRSSKVEMDGSFSSSSEDNVEVSNIVASKPNSRVKKVNSFSKTGVPTNYSPNSTLSPGSQPRKTLKTGEKDALISSSPQDTETSLSSFNSAIIRRSSLATNSPTSTSSENSSADSTTHSVAVTAAKPFRGQTVIWPPRNQSSNPSDVATGSPPSSKATSVDESRSPHGVIEPQASNDEEESHRVPHSTGIPTETQKPSLKESGKEINPVFAEARNTTFSQSLDVSNHLALSYLGRNETPIKVERKGSADEGRNMGGAEDWRVLVRQRREDRMKQTKTPEAEEIILEARPSVSRNSKVLEMANNFQKLQVA